MGSITIKFHGFQDEILRRMTEYGIAETKSEAIRMALLKFALDLGLVDEKTLLKSLRKELGASRVSAGEILGEIERVKNESISR